MEHFDRVVATHLRGVVLGMKFVAPVMIRQGSGSIINTGSIAGLRTGYSAHSYSTAGPPTVPTVPAVSGSPSRHRHRPIGSGGRGLDGAPHWTNDRGPDPASGSPPG